MRIGHYLSDTRKHGIIYKPDKTKELECYVDADFAGSWLQADADNAENILSCSGYVSMYANFPILWVSHLQTEIALSTSEVEYIALSQSLLDVIPLLTLLKEINKVFVIGPLYSVQYKSIFGVPDKVRCNTCEVARPSRLDFQRDKVKIHHVLALMQDCWS
jgi:hypothetical protein